jgi:hypothetical protein
MPALNQMKLWRSSIRVDTALQIKLAGIGHRRLELESGAGDGNRKYRLGDDNHLKSWRYEIARAARAIFV